MNISPTPSLLRSLSAEHRGRLMRVAREVSIPQGTRLFEEGARADRFWIIHTGRIELDMRVPGRRAAVIENLGHNEMVGWSWLFTPHVWHLAPRRPHRSGPTSSTPRPSGRCARTIRLWARTSASGWARSSPTASRSTRTRLLDLYAPYGAGSTV